MLHVVAFIVIGLVVGAFFVRKTRSVAALVRVAGGLVGSLLGGFISLARLGQHTDVGKYGSIVIAVLAAVAAAALFSLLSNLLPGRGRY